jgi:hypothetical protein
VLSVGLDSLLLMESGVLCLASTVCPSGVFVHPQPCIPCVATVPVLYFTPVSLTAPCTTYHTGAATHEAADRDPAGAGGPQRGHGAGAERRRDARRTGTCSVVVLLVGVVVCSLGRGDQLLWQLAVVKHVLERRWLLSEAMFAAESVFCLFGANSVVYLGLCAC